MASDPYDPRPQGQVKVTLSGEFAGFPVTLQLQADIRRLPATLSFLEDQGLTRAKKPITWSYTADGLPICPVHGAPMKKREKQGDEWYSHKVVSPSGDDLYCRGYPGPESPGYFISVEDLRR